MKEHDILSHEQKSEKNDNNNNKIKNIKTQSYKKLPEGQNFESIKEKFESFLKQREDKEPNIQSKVINSLLSSKEDMNNNNTNNIGNNNNKSLVKNIQEKIKILKDNKNKIQNGKEYDYINEIDECYNKIKSKEENDNLTLKKYYNELINKENDFINEKSNNMGDIKETRKKSEIENTKISENKKTIVQKSKRLEYYMRNLLNNKKYNYFDYHYLSNKINKTKTKNKENININNMYYYGNSAPDINLIAEQGSDENIKLIDENDYIKFRRKNIRSSRISNDNNNSMKNIANKNHRRNSDNSLKYSNYVSPRLIIKGINHKIMPPNELN